MARAMAAHGGVDVEEVGVAEERKEEKDVRFTWKRINVICYTKLYSLFL